MSVFNKIISLSKQIAASLIKNETPISLDKSDLFNEEDKKYILNNLTEESTIKKHQELRKKINAQDDWKEVEPKKLARKQYWQYAVATVVIGILSTTFFLRDSIFNNNSSVPIIVNMQIKTGTDKAILTLDTGEEVALVKGTSIKTPSAISNGEEIVYTSVASNQKPKANSQIAYNTLTIPRGGQYQITLSDGTEVWLNSETQLKYPVRFSKDVSRKVELVYGEAYFDVSPSTKHRGSTFQVINKGQNVEVLGTEFNIKAYKGEANIYTTLVEGKILVSCGKTKQHLIPNQQSNINLNTNVLTVTTVNVYNEIAWKEGVFSFENKPLKDIMTVLSRWYDFEVSFENLELENLKFIGSLNKSSSIENILFSMKNTNIINSFEINNRSIIIK